MHYILKAKDKPNKKSMGGKAFALAKLNGKIPIPDWFVITPDAYLDSISPNGTININNKLSKIIFNEANKLNSSNNLFAVRSSAIAEDGKSTSFAGQFKSFLNVRQKDLLSKIIEVWESGFAKNVQRYQSTLTNISENQIPAVIIQKMVNADKAGVGFSVDPITGNTESCVIVSTKNLADKLVSGEINGNTYFLNKKGIVQKENKFDNDASLSQNELIKITELMHKVENEFEYPQDIEWAIEANKIYLVQSRPITTLKETIVWDNSNIVESYSGITSPLTFSFAIHVYEQVYKQFCLIMGVSKKTIEKNHNVFANMLGIINGNIYYNLISWYKALALFPGFNINRSFMEEMMGVKESLPTEILNKIKPKNLSLMESLIEILKLCRTSCGLILNAFLIHFKIKSFYKKLNRLLISKDLKKMSLYELGDYYTKLEKDLIDKWDAPLINDFFCMIAFGISKKLALKLAGKQGEQIHNSLLIDQGEIISAEPARRIKEMANLIRGNPELINTMINSSTEQSLNAINKNNELKLLYDEYITKFEDRCLQELKLESLTLKDNPSTLIHAVASLAIKEEVKRENKQSSIDEAKLFFKKKPIEYQIIKAVSSWAKYRVRHRENLRFERTRVFGRIRQIFLEIGRRMQEKNVLESYRDIFYLEIFEILSYCKEMLDTKTIQEVVIKRKELEKKYQSLEKLPNRFTCQNKDRYIVIDPKNLQVKKIDTTHISNNAKHGIGCCPGIIEATVQIINDPKNAKLNSGEIMVALHTDPGWITLFTNAAGILVERGSLLSHSAIVSRELGIPAIVSIDNVTTWLKNGDLVRMNGATGEIILLNRKTHE